MRASVAGTLWIGISDRISEGTFVNVTGGAPGYTNWAGSPPTNAAEDCGSVLAPPFWEAQDCAVVFASVCECDGATAVPGTY